MVKVRKTSIDQAEKFQLPHKLWGTEAYKPNVYVQLAYDDEGITVRFTVDGESNPLRNKNAHLSYVHEDSCVEFFVNFTPECSKHYINFETNAAGYMNVAFRTCRQDAELLSLADIESFRITPVIYDNYWTVTYKIGFDFIKKYYPTFDINTCEYLLGNFYKCGDLTEMPHFVSYFMMGDTMDYHRPEYFGKIAVEH